MKFLKYIYLFIIVGILIFTVIKLKIILTYNNNITNIPEPFQKNMHTVDLFDENFSEIRSRKNILEQLKDINHKFNTSNNFDFIEINLSSVYGNNKIKYNAAYFDENVMDYFSLKTENNKKFERNYFENNLKNIPIILGNNYKSQYKIGDKIKLIIRGYETDCYILDFINKGESIIYFNTQVNLDDYFIIPFIKTINDKEYSLNDINEYNFRLLLDKNNGLVIPKNNLKNVKLEIKNISNSYSLPYTLSTSYLEDTNYIKYSLIIYTLVIIFLIVILIKIIRNLYKKRYS